MPQSQQPKDKKRCIKDKLEEAFDLAEQIKKEAAVVREALNKDNDDDRGSSQRKASIGRS